MRTKDKINKIIREIGFKYGLNLPVLTSNNICTMTYKDDLTFVIEVPENGGGIFFYTPLIEKTDENDEALQRMLLEQNFLFGNADGAAFALDEQTGDVVLCRVHPEQDLDAQDFEQKIESFLNTAESSREMLVNWQQGGNKQEQTGGKPADETMAFFPVNRFMA